MEVSFLMVAAHAEVLPDGKINLLSGNLDTIRIPTDVFPVTTGTPLYIVGHVDFFGEECGQEYTSRVELVAPDGTVLHGADSQIKVVPQPLAGRASKIDFSITLLGITFPVAGDYHIKLLVDKKEIKRIPLYIEQIPPGTT